MTKRRIAGHIGYMAKKYRADDGAEAPVPRLPVGPNK